MADAILQMFGNTLGAGTTNSLAFVDLPQSGRVRKIVMMPIWRGYGAGDIAAIFEVSTLPTARFFNNGDFGNVMARGSWSVDITTSGGLGLNVVEITGLDYRVSVGQRLFLHVYVNAIPTGQDDCIVDVYLDS